MTSRPIGFNPSDFPNQQPISLPANGGPEVQKSLSLNPDQAVVSYQRPGGIIPQEIRQRILQSIASGMQVLEVSRKFHVHPTTISGWKRAARNHDASPKTSPTAHALKPASESPPRETGRYSQAFKEEVLAQAKSGRKIIEVAAQYRIPGGTINRWRREAEAAGGSLPEPQSTRPVSSGPSPINPEHRALVLALKEKHPNMGLAQVQNQLKRFHAIKLGLQMIGRIFSEAGIPLQKPSPSEAERKAAENRFEMSRPNELWAVDFKEFWVHSEKVHALFILDDFSRFCLGFALTQDPTAELAIATVEKAIQKYGRPERILSDRGPQFHAWNGVSKFDAFLASFFIDHSVTKAGHCFTNGKIEAFNRSIESELLDVEEFSSLKEAEDKIKHFVQRYNFLRTHMGIAGLVPADRYFGMVEEAQEALASGLKRIGPGLSWLKGLVSDDGPGLRQPSLLQLALSNGKLELVVLGRRFTLG